MSSALPAVKPPVLDTLAIKPYLDRFIFRKGGFAYGKLRGAVPRQKMADIRLAKAFSRADQDHATLFQQQLPLASGLLRRDIAEIHERYSAKGKLAYEEHRTLLAEIGESFTRQGVFTDWGRPEGVGLIINRTEIEGFPVYFVLNELADGRSVHSGRYHFPGEHNPRKYVTLNVTSIASRVIEMFDILYNGIEGRRSSDIREDDSEQTRIEMMRMRAAEYSAVVSHIEASGKKIPPIFMLDVIIKRASMRRLLLPLKDSATQEEYLMKVIDSEVKARLAHEIAHVVERRANGDVHGISIDSMEMLAYLLEGTYGRPDSALRSLTEHRILQRNLTDESQHGGLLGPIARLGNKAFRKNEDFLRRLAEVCLDKTFIGLTGKTHREALDPAPIARTQECACILPEHMPLLERALINPFNLGAGRQLRRVR